HMWTPDVYEGAPTPVTAFFAAVPKVAGLALLIRFVVQPLGDLQEVWRQIVILVSVLSMVVGAFAALRQYNIKRLLAYSSIGHVGYALIAVASGDRHGIQAALIYITIYALVSVGAFGCVLLMRRRNEHVEAIEDLAGAGRSHPVYALVLSI
ncbi:MAG: NADH-quinone oxidoreductase subunit N, partial [Rickettsiales bacterium]|nr:NADH-quinone oxidoreductase subunit N [Rickettsiales bacterium]